ncbi:hypothetical protein LEP1GSC058_2303 [Leptospira fainei serovar Hurstbridge str. BUT 6]|uniref:Uncharacterized protein n=1 Tax=Leptospira fainei serovar Hurstbridge str. BUT 6 TaxID=1193011 RepID=S3V4T7_9LEPT|nr:hypothetical protein [Leptospira fainei]EPG75614.1 hypothetical protein LEP1GSC058_2303 [Leptospira fainei serovar Hurstbridge str. BUT 6]
MNIKVRMKAKYLPLLTLLLFGFPVASQSFYSTGTEAGFFDSYRLTGGSPLVPNYQNYSPNFRSEVPLTVGGTETATAADRKKERDRLELRRSFLNWHQGLGLLTWGFWLATNLAGERALSHLHREYQPFADFVLLSNPQQNLLAYNLILNASPWTGDPGGNTHKSLAGTTFTLYALSAGLAFLAPSNTLAREPGLTTIFTHKAMIWIHLPAMLALPFLGQEVPKNGPGAAHRMEAVGWTGFAAFTISIATFYF